MEQKRSSLAGAGRRDQFNAAAYSAGKWESISRQIHRLSGSNTIGSYSAELSAEFSQNRRATPHIKKPIWHIALSSPIHEQLNDAQYQQVEIAYLDFMGLARNNHQYVVIRHHDEPQGHVHIVANRIGEDGNVHHLRWDRLRTIQATRALEEKFGFLSVKPREGLRQHVRSRIGETAHDQPSLLTFCQRLEKRGLVPGLYQRGGEITGIAYLYQNQRMAESALGKSYSFPGLQKAQQISYQPEKDFDSRVQRGNDEAQRRRSHNTTARTFGQTLPLLWLDVRLNLVHH